MAKGNKGKFYLPQSTLELYAAYLIATVHKSNRQALVDLKDLLGLMDVEKTYATNEQKERNTYTFLKNLVQARLDGLEDRDILISKSLDGVDQSNLFPMNKLDRQLNLNELSYLEGNIIENRNEYYAIAFMADAASMYDSFTMADDKGRHDILTNLKDRIYKTNRNIKASVNINSITESFSLEEESFEDTIKEVYTRACDASTKLKTGMKAFNMSLNGGFESSRCYVYLGLPGEGKSSTLLNLALQIKKNNPEVKTKDPTKKPVVVFLTMENTLNETVERIFNMVVSDEEISSFQDYTQVLNLLKTNGITVSDNNPVGLEFRYVPSNTVDTDYLYTLYDELMAEGKECICMIQDYIKRIKCRDFKLINGDMRIGLGAVIDEFKEFANTKKIPVITASQMNRDAAKIIDENRRTNKADLVRMIGRSNIGESTLITENADAAFILVPEEGRDGIRYLGISNAKKRFKNQSTPNFYHPYCKERPLQLIEDINLAEPLFKISLNTIDETKGGAWNKVDNPDNIEELSDRFGMDVNEVTEVKQHKVNFGNTVTITHGQNEISNMVTSSNLSLDQQRLLSITTGKGAPNGDAPAQIDFDPSMLSETGEAKHWVVNALVHEYTYALIH